VHYCFKLSSLFPGVKRPRREAERSPPSSAEVKKTWSYTFTPPYVFMAWHLVRQRDNFTFTLPVNNNLALSRTKEIVGHYH
jgi:hypothetical protein